MVYRCFARWLCVFVLSSGVVTVAERPAMGSPDAGAPASHAGARERALDLTDLGEKAYREGRFAEAADLLQRAYELYPSAVLLYNLARVQESAGNDRQAADLYQRYLEADPAAGARRTIEKRVATLRARERERQEAKRERDLALGRAARAEQARLDSSSVEPLAALPWIVSGVGVAGVAAGVVFGVIARNEESKADEEVTHAGAIDRFDRAETFATAANVALVAGSVVTAGGIVWLVVQSATSRKTSRPRAEVRLGAGHATVRGSF
jgi:tetratricopeptide (TPR) repeat protein